jgi:intracellular multiplication protein IcmL
MANDALETVRLRNNFYRDNYRKVVTALLMALVAIVALVLVISYMMTHRPSPTYFATTAKGRIIPLVPLSVPTMNTEGLLQWATEAAMSAYTFNFINYRQQLQSSRQYFTPNGWNGFMKGLYDSGNLKAVISKKLIVNAVPGGAPVIINEGTLNGRYIWKIQMPMLVTYHSANETFHNTWMVNMTVTRISTLDSVRGVGVDQINYTSS